MMGTPISVVRWPGAEGRFDWGVLCDQGDHLQVFWGDDDGGTNEVTTGGLLKDYPSAWFERQPRIRVVTTDPECVARAAAWCREACAWWMDA